MAALRMSDGGGVLCVFAKPPVPGQVKTRLAAELGAERAAELARAFLCDTWAAVEAIPWVRPVLATTERGLASVLGLDAEEWLQGSGDLGERLERLLARALAEGASFGMAIGADTPGLPARLLDEARDALAGADAVLGPSEDGGFYLIGLRRCPSGLLCGLPWSCRQTFTHTLARLRDRGLETRVLPAWFDVDLPSDVVRLGELLARAEIHAPGTASVLGAAMPVGGSASPGRVSVVVPTLDEEARIGGLLEELSGIPGLREIIVADGGSRDRTLEIARSFPGVRALAAPRGRASQMNRGARAATGEVLLFLHADVMPPADMARWVDKALADERVVAGAFRIWTIADGGRSWLGPLLHLADLRSRYSGLPYGDQALFVRAEAFWKAGGFPDQPLLEDLELSRRLRRLGRIRTVPATVRVSGRRFIARPVYYTLMVNVLPLLYRIGIPPAVLAGLYGNPR